MDKFIKIVGWTVIGAGTFFLLPLLGVIFGAFAGWVVGLFWSPTILGFLQRIGVDTAGLQVWEVGAALGFLGAFFKSSLTAKN